MNKTLLVAKREFLSRVQKKTFLLSTILLPLIIFGFYAGMIYFSVKTTDNYQVAVIDHADVFKGKIDDNPSTEVIFRFVKEDTAALKAKLLKKEYDAYLLIPANFTISGQDSLEFMSGKTVGLMTREKIQRRISKALEEKRMLAMNISKAQLDSIQSEKEYIQFETTSGRQGKTSRAGISYAVGMISGFLIYIILFVYGTMVMRGVMEEKVSRIAEVIVSSVKPFQLMLGKITGIGAVGLLQFLIWIVLVFVLQMALPLIFPGLADQAQATPMPGAIGAVQTAKQSGMMSGLMSALSEVNFSMIIGCFLFYFLGGYLLYSSMFAVVGCAVNEDPQDAQSLILPIMMPIIFAIVIMMKAVNDPNSGLAVFGSIFPLTSPIVMMARVAHGVPEGVSVVELIASMVLLIAGFLATTWMAGKIYRTGILMYGKKPSWKEMLKWAFRKN